MNKQTPIAKNKTNAAVAERLSRLAKAERAAHAPPPGLEILRHMRWEDLDKSNNRILIPKR
jgi:hypothetical protein